MRQRVPDMPNDAKKSAKGSAIQEKALLKKQELRAWALQKRRALPPEERIRAGACICRRVRSLPEYQKASRILCYASLEEEVPTGELMAGALLDGKQVYCPRVEGDGRMSFYQIRSLQELTPGFRRIPEPSAQESRKYRRETHAFVSGQESPPFPCDLILMPGTAFDRQGGRLGYGGGYYDRFLQKTEEKDDGVSGRSCVRLLKIALCFSCQLMEEPLPQEATDIRPDFIITEQETINMMRLSGPA